MATWLDAATCRRIEENVAQQLPSRTSQLPTPECFLSTNSVIMHHGQAYFFAITSTFHCNFAEWSNDWDLEGSCSLSCIQAIARHNCATEALSETNCLCVVLPRGPQGTGPRCANFWISIWCESPHWWIYYINGKRDPERAGTHKGVNNTGAQSARSCQWAYQLQDVLLPLEANDWNTFHRSGSLLDVQATAETAAQHQCVSEEIVRLEVLCLLCSVGCCIWVASFVPSISMMEPETLKFQNTHQTPENWWNAFEMAEFWCGQLTSCYVEPWYLCINKIKGNRAGLMA